LGSGAHLTRLRRTRVGAVKIDRCLTIDEALKLIETTTITYPDDYNKVLDAEK
jgi:tRNA U55 pseudouridine synthase TruB